MRNRWIRIKMESIKPYQINPRSTDICNREKNNEYRQVEATSQFEFAKIYRKNLTTDLGAH